MIGIVFSIFFILVGSLVLIPVLVLFSTIFPGLLEIFSNYPSHIQHLLSAVFFVAYIITAGSLGSWIAKNLNLYWENRKFKRKK